MTLCRALNLIHELSTLTNRISARFFYFIYSETIFKMSLNILQKQNKDVVLIWNICFFEVVWNYSNKSMLKTVLQLSSRNHVLSNLILCFQANLSLMTVLIHTVYIYMFWTAPNRMKLSLFAALLFIKIYVKNLSIRNSALLLIC